ncbi:MAG TPA: PEGA domain-containing protein [Kofleriaceae bacterium]|jgi:hypothetical protein
MIRALGALLVLCLAGGVAWSKPQIGILGLEVSDTGSGIDPQTTNVAREITNELRARARMPTGQYTNNPSAEKELIDEKLLKNCDNEGLACMSEIGRDLQVELLMYGKIEKATDHGQPIYKIYIKLLNVGRKQLVSSTAEQITVSAAAGSGSSAAARAWYNKLTGSSDGGTLIVKANADRGTVLIDQEEKGTLASGTLTIQKLPEGKHTIEIEAPGYDRYTETITIRNGETTNQGATLKSSIGTTSVAVTHNDGAGGTLIDQGGTVSHPAGNVWRKVAIGSGVVAVAGLGTWLGTSIYMWNTGLGFKNGVPQWGDSCPPHAMSGACHFGEHGGNSLNIATGAIGVAAGALTIYAFIRSRHESEASGEHAERGHRHSRDLVITPVATPTSAGAAMQFTW